MGTSEKNNYWNVNLIFSSSFLPFTNCSRFEKLPLNSAKRRGSILSPKDYLPELLARFFCFSKTC